MWSQKSNRVLAMPQYDPGSDDNLFEVADIGEEMNYDGRLYGEKMIDDQVFGLAQDGNVELGRTQQLMIQSGMVEREALTRQLHHINRELLGLGLPCPLRVSVLPEELEDSTRIVESLDRLLGLVRARCTAERTLVAKLRQRDLDEQDLMAKISRLREQYERECGRNAKFSHEVERMRRESDRLRDDKTRLEREVRRCMTGLEVNKTQFAQQVKKRDLEMQRLRDRMQKLLSERYSVGGNGSGSGSVGGNGTMSNGRVEVRDHVGAIGKEGEGVEKMIRELEKNYEENERELIRENERLKRAIMAVGEQVRVVNGETEEGDMFSLDAILLGINKLGRKREDEGVRGEVKDKEKEKKKEKEREKEREEMQRVNNEQQQVINELLQQIEKQQGTIVTLTKIINSKKREYARESEGNIHKEERYGDLKNKGMEEEEEEEGAGGGEGEKRGELERERREVERAREQVEKAAIEVGRQREQMLGMVSKYEQEIMELEI